MSLPLPDYNKKIHKGDISFVYKGVYHPIQWFGSDPYRPRVETIVIRNGNQIFIRKYEEKGDYDYSYRLPGGSLDNDSTKIKQAENEVNEEALLRLDNIYQSSVSYFENYPDGFLLKNGDICIAYKGTYTDVFVAEYKGKQDKSKIDSHDLDDDMANNGKFYYITNVCELLRPEHIDAILNCPFVSDNIKGAVRLILNNKITTPSSVVNESVILTEGKVANPRKHHYNTYMMIELMDNEQPFGVNELSRNITDNIWLATDVHIGDPKDTWENKRRRILKSINKHVNEDDHLLFLGDMVGHDDNVTVDMLKGFIKLINCRNVYLILGNNDYFTMEEYKSVGFKAVTDKFYYKDYIFTHCALPDVPEGYLNIHGHIHGSGMYYDMDPDRHIDVWDDNYIPIRLTDIVKKYESGEYIGHRKDFNLMVSTESINTSIVPIFTVNCRYNSAFGVTTRTLTGSDFNHSSIALYSDLSEMYSYVRNLSGLSEKDRKTGFDVETLDYYTKRDGNAIMSVNAVFINKNDFVNLQNRINKYLKSSSKTLYDYKNLFRIVFGVSIDNENINDDKMICSEFVAKMLTIANVDLPKSANLMIPDDIENLSKTNSNVINVFTGRIKDYSKKKVDKTIKEISSTLSESSVVESCKNLTDARKLVNEVRKIAKKHNANFFFVTDGASGYSNGNGEVNPAVKSMRKCMDKWENDNGFNPDDDWSNDINDTSNYIKKSVTESSKYSIPTNQKYFFLSKVSMNDEVLMPRIPDNFMTKNGYEDNTTPRVCFSKSIDGALAALSRNLEGEELFVHIPDEKHQIYNPTIKEVPDKDITDEVWIKEKVNVRMIGKIKILKAKPKGRDYTYGDNKKATIYFWDWKWLWQVDENGKTVEESIVQEISAFDSDSKVMSNINISTLHKRVIDEHTLRPYLKEFNALNYIDLSEDAKGFIFFDEEENPVAYVNVINDAEGVYSIQQLQVLPKYKKCGLTSQLIDIAVRELRANKAVVSKRNEELHEEYLREGFRDIDETQFSYTMGKGNITLECVVIESNTNINDDLDNVKSPGKLSEWMCRNITYNHTNHFRSFEEVLSDKKGDCHDQVEFESKIFSNMGVKYGKLFVAEYKELPKCGTTHSLLYYYENGKIYWFENAWDGNEGIHGPYKSVKDLKEDVSNKWKFNNGCDKLIWSNVKNVEPGMSLNDYVVNCLGSKIDKYIN